MLSSSTPDLILTEMLFIFFRESTKSFASLSVFRNTEATVPSALIPNITALHNAPEPNLFMSYDKETISVHSPTLLNHSSVVFPP